MRFQAVLMLAACAATMVGAAEPKPVITGKVVSESGQPLVGAEVGLQVWGFDEQDKLPTGDLLAVTFTGTDGRYELTIPKEIEPSQKLATVWAIAEGHIPGRPGSVMVLGALVNRGATIRLRSSKETVVRVVTPAGKVAEGVTVRVVSQRMPESIGFPIPERWREALQATTNDRGEAWIAHALPDAIDGMTLERPNFATVVLGQNYFLNARPAEAGPTFTVPLPETGTVLGRLTAVGTELPKVEELLIQTESSIGERSLPGRGEATVRPDSEGRFRIEGMPVGTVMIPPFLPKDQSLRAMSAVRTRVMPDGNTDLLIRLCGE